MIDRIQITQDQDIYRIIGAILNLTPKELEVLKYLASIANSEIMTFEVKHIDCKELGCTNGTVRNYLSALKKKLAVNPTGMKGQYKLNVLLSVDSFNLNFIWKDKPTKELSYDNLIEEDEHEQPSIEVQTD